jgi:3,4-dihydroxy 2-butanone 4-phosphate synthase/GTP cyclohydrolase II
MVRIHSQCFTGDTLFSLRCDCGEQLEKSMEIISKHGSGILIYLSQEGRGIGLANKIKAYQLQDQGLDTVEANHALGFSSDGRNYQMAANILKDLGVTKIMLITNNPDKIEQLKNNGITIVKRIPLKITANTVNKGYLLTKKQKMGHLL